MAAAAGEQVQVGILEGPARKERLREIVTEFFQVKPKYGPGLDWLTISKAVPYILSDEEYEYLQAIYKEAETEYNENLPSMEDREDSLMYDMLLYAKGWLASFGDLTEVWDEDELEGGKRKSPKRKSPKRKSPKRKSPKHKSSKKRRFKR